MAIGNAANAGLLAVRILATSGQKATATTTLDKQFVNEKKTGSIDLLDKMEQYMVSQEEEVLKKADRLETLGFRDY